MSQTGDPLGDVNGSFHKVYNFGLVGRGNVRLFFTNIKKKREKPQRFDAQTYLCNAKTKNRRQKASNKPSINSVRLNVYLLFSTIY